MQKDRSLEKYMVNSDKYSIPNQKLCQTLSLSCCEYCFLGTSQDRNQILAIITDISQRFVGLMTFIDIN